MELDRSTHGSRRGLLLIALAAVLWGTVGVSTRALYDLSATNPLSIGFFRLALAAPALIAACVAVLRGDAWRLSRRDLGLAALIGLMLGLYQACFFTAIGYAGVSISTLVTLCTAPVIAALFGAVLARERLSWPVATALGLALAGTVLLVGPGTELANGRVLTGALFALGSAFGYGVMAVIGRLVAGSAHPMVVNAVAFSSGALILLAIAVPSGFVTSYPAQGWALLLYLGLVPSAIGYVLFLRGMATTTATSATIVTLLEPLTATLLAWLLFGERLGPLGLAGGLLLLAALGVLYRAR